MTTSELRAREEIATFSRKIHKQGLVAATDGNLSVRLDNERILITPSGIRKEDVTIDDPVIIDYEGNVIGGNRTASSERKIHLKAFAEREDVNACIHAHPPYAIALTVAKAPFDTCLLPEMVVRLGSVPVASYATPSTDDLPASIDPYIRRCDTIMLERHGSLTVGKTLVEAFELLEKLEQAARISFYAMLIGGPVPFPQGEIERLRGLREFYGVQTKQLACPVCGNTNVPASDKDSAVTNAEYRRLVDLITERVMHALGEQG